MSSIDLNSIDLNLLVAFESLFEEQSVTAAAERMHIGQSAMSYALKRLRILFEDELFIRSGREMQPTIKAKAVAPGISAALQQIRQTLQSNQQFDPATARQTFIIGSSDYASAVIVPRLLEICQREAPGINLRLLSYEKDRVVTLLERQTVDVILGSSFQRLPPQIMQIPLMEERLVGVCRDGHPVIIPEATVDLDTYISLSHALFTLRQDDIGVIDQALAQRGLQRRIVFTTPYVLTLPKIVLSSDIIAAIPFHLAQCFTAEDSIRQFEIPLHMAPWHISMLGSKLSEQDPAAAWLRQTIQNICQALEKGE